MDMPINREVNASLCISAKACFRAFIENKLYALPQPNKYNWSTPVIRYIDNRLLSVRSLFFYKFLLACTGNVLASKLVCTATPSLWRTRYSKYYGKLKLKCNYIARTLMARAGRAARGGAGRGTSHPRPRRAPAASPAGGGRRSAVDRKSVV